LKALSQSKRWQGDGTFSTASTGFYQLYTIHGLYKWQMITCLWTLLSGKIEILYKKMLNEIKNGGLVVGLELKQENCDDGFRACSYECFYLSFS
jgi:hypothetical protein